MAYLKKFGIGNFRVFKEYTEFDLAPITVLTGKNNSGKSSFIKALLLMKKNMNIGYSINNDLSIDFEYLGLGDVDTIFNKKNKTIEFLFSFERYCWRMKMNILVKLIYYKNNERENTLSLSEIKIFDADTNIFLFGVIDDYKKKTIISEYNIEYFIDKINQIDSLNSDVKVNILDSLKSQNKIIVHSKVKENNSDDLKNYGYNQAGLYQLIKAGFWNEEVLKEYDNNLDIKAYLGYDLILNLIKYHSGYSRPINSFEKIEYLPPIRANINRIHSKYSNLIMDIMLEQTYKKKLLNVKIYKDFFVRQLKRFEIGNDIIIKSVDNTINIVSVIMSSGEKVNLSDLGLGYSQLLPIILKIILQAKTFSYEEPDNERKVFIKSFNESLFLLEEPEANLHPDFQSKLAELFVDAMKTFNIQFIIETHSEYLIRKLQYLTAKKEIMPEDTAIYYFNNPENIPKGEEQVYRIRIDEFGGLSDSFGKGFFDETSRLQFELLKLTKNQMN